MLQRDIKKLELLPAHYISVFDMDYVFRVLLIGHRFAVGTVRHTSALTLMVQLFATCLIPHHKLWCGCSACRKRKSVHGGLVAVGLAGGQTFGALCEPL